MKSAKGDALVFQAVYSIECDVEDYIRFSEDEMSLIDCRDGHMTNKALSEKEPPFLYVIPLGGKRLFYEETSSVSNPAMDLGVLKK